MITLLCAIRPSTSLRASVGRSALYVIIVCGFLAGCISTEYNVATHKQDIFFVSTAKEIDLGHNIAKSVALQVKISANPCDIERVNRIGKRIAEVCDRRELNYYFYVIDKDEKNAFAAPGGHVFVYKALFDSLDDDQLAFVLAHEVAHVVSRHSIKRMQALLGANLLVIASMNVPSSGNNLPQGLSYALAQLTMAYSREDELCADALAAKYVKAAGFRAQAALEVLEKLYEDDKKNIRDFSYFRSHPYTAQRVKAIKKALNLPWDVDDYIND